MKDLCSRTVGEGVPRRTRRLRIPFSGRCRLHTQEREARREATIYRTEKPQRHGGKRPHHGISSNATSDAST